MSQSKGESLMPSISDTLHIASQAIENALTANSMQKVTPTTGQSAIHNHKKNTAHYQHSGKMPATEKEDEETKETILTTEKVLSNHIDLRA